MTINIVTCSASSIIGINNYGDELLTQIYGNWVSECDSSISVSHLAIDSHGFLSRDARRQIQAASCVIFTGGGYFADGYGFSDLLRRHARALRNRRVYWSVFKHARRFEIPCAVFGLEVGPLANPPYRSSVRKILRSARKVVVRNPESGEYIRKLCGDSVVASVRLDAALAAPLGIKAGAVAVERLPGDVCIGLHVHEVDSDTTGEDCIALLAHVKSQLPVDRPFHVYYIHDQRKRGTHPASSSRAEKYFASRLPGLKVIPYVDPVETTAVVAAMDLVVTSKLHVGIVARSFGVPVIAIGSHPKIPRFYEYIEEGESCRQPSAFISAGLPASALACLSEDHGRIPVGMKFRESAAGNREAVRDLIASII